MSINDIRWVHKITLPDGTVTPGEWVLGLDEWGLSQLDFKNKRLLDIGCLDGGYSFFAEAQGAREVVSIDIIEARKNKTAYPQAAYTNEAYMYAHKAFKSKAKYVFPFSTYDVTPEEFGTFDIVFFLGVLYHLAHPLLALEKINRVLKPGGVLAIESEISRSFTGFYHALHLQHTLQPPDNLSTKRPALQSIAKSRTYQVVRSLFQDQADVYNNDSSIFWVPTMATLERLIDFAGFSMQRKFDDGESSRASYICRKVAEPNSVYAAESMYTHYKNRSTNMRLKRKG